MAKRIQLRRGTTAQSNAFTGAVGEVTVDTDKDVLVVHDGVTAGGYPNAAKANNDNSVSIVGKNGIVLGIISNAGLFYDGLNNTATNQALTANMGYVLNNQIVTTNSKLFGEGQSWQDVTSSRNSGTTYTNTTGKPILISIFTTKSAESSSTVQITVSGILVAVSDTSGNDDTTLTTVVPNNTTYSAAIVGYTLGTDCYWRELR